MTEKINPIGLCHYKLSAIYCDTSKILKANFDEQTEIIMRRTSLKSSVIGDNDEEIKIFINKVCKHYGITYDLLRSKKRTCEYAELRMIMAVLILETFGLYLNQTGKYFNRDHSTILYYRKVAKGFLKYDYNFKKKYYFISNFLKR